MDTSNHLPTLGMKVSLMLSYQNLMSSSFRQAALTAFGPKLKEQLHCSRDLKVICRPDQFAIFLFERNRMGGTNSFKDLKVQLIDPPAFLNPVLDVSDAA